MKTPVHNGYDYTFNLYVGTSLTVYIGKNITIMFNKSTKYSDYVNTMHLLGRPKSCQYLVDLHEVELQEYLLHFNRFFSLGE